ncbi:tetratricopeptide repeat protein [Blastopirellula marina]|uniref:tetratricopeptide repeat protein n=1 Tax=Blastopirellula marina TaxID=124 RepID=UPI00103F11BD|nr:tetratricopeptide repeat protein [Blastopirellula marina]
MDQMELAQEEWNTRRQAEICLKFHDNTNAVKHQRRSLKLCEQLFGEKSFKSTCARLALAQAIFLSKANLDDGIAVAEQARQRFDELGVAESENCVETQLVLVYLYAEQDQNEKAIEAGEQSIRILEKMQYSKSSTYTKLTGVLADVLNQQKKHDQALRYAMKGRTNSSPQKGGDANDYFRLLKESGRARMGLEDHEKACQEYEYLIYRVNDETGFPEDKRLEYLEEYAGVLKKIGNDERLGYIESKIAKLKNESQDNELPEVEKSRYSN